MGGSGISWVLLEAPRREGFVSVGAAKDKNIRPYFIHVSLEEILGWKHTINNNVSVLTQLRIMETVNEDDPDDEFGIIKVPQVRVFDLIDGFVSIRVFQETKGKWVQVGEAVNTQMKKIHLYPLYINRSGFMTGEPLLDDLADVNIAHWQSQSDQRNILRAARVPILHSKGRDTTDGALVIGASTAVESADPDATLEWVEHTGAAINSGRQDLKDLEFQMEALGLQLLVPRPGVQTATGEELDNKKETSTLSMTADELKDTLEDALMGMAEVGGLSGEIVVEVNKDFGASVMSANELSVLLSAVESGKLSKRSFLIEMARRGMVRYDIDIEGELKLVEQEGGKPENDGGKPEE
jgi:hypothetical protein